MSSVTKSFAAIDLGATSGRVMVGQVGQGLLDLAEVHRFENNPIQADDGLFWDIEALCRGVLEGLREAGRSGDIASIGIDAWAVDYGLLDEDGGLIERPYHYRDARTSDEVIDRVHRSIPPDELYQLTGLQHLPFNTIYQLAAAAGSPSLHRARTLLLIPDLIAFRLTGRTGTELTNASTTGLLDTSARTWSKRAAGAINLDISLLAPLRTPGEGAGNLLERTAESTGLPRSVQVTAVASHDTASAVAAVPATDPRFAYISCGTWSLAGIELAGPVLTEASRRANFTNELGVDGTVRYLRNIMGLWLLTESQRAWAARGQCADLHVLLAEALRAEPLACVVDPDDPLFLPPGDIPARIAEYCERTGQRPPQTQGAAVRCILESLALAHRHALRQASILADREIDVVHLVGGGSRNDLLCQLTADATGLPVLAGPAEATALGNVLIQARARGLAGDLAAMRRMVADRHVPRRYEPRGNPAQWRAAAERVGLH